MHDYVEYPRGVDESGRGDGARSRESRGDDPRSRETSARHTYDRDHGSPLAV